MPYTVYASFQQFRRDKVDLEAAQVPIARRSRDYLQDQVGRIAGSDADFPPLYSGYMAYGSFARNTKIRPLNDIDMLVLLNGKNTSSVLLHGYTYGVRVTDQESPLSQYVDENGYLNSRRILNKFKSALRAVPNYRQAEIKVNQVAVVLDLTSYPWVFDIVPAFPVSDGMGGISHYNIPDGYGNWMRTDPRRDQRAITSANKNHNNNLIPLMRLMKYWNVRRHSPPKLASYYFETLIINGSQYIPAVTNIRKSLPAAFRQLGTQVMSSCPDPKGLGPNLDDNVSWDTKNKLQDAANTMAQYAEWALEYEDDGDYEEAIKWWRYIFSDFPSYGS